MMELPTPPRIPPDAAENIRRWVRSIAEQRIIELIPALEQRLCTGLD